MWFSKLFLLSVTIIPLLLFCNQVKKASSSHSDRNAPSDSVVSNSELHMEHYDKTLVIEGIFDSAGNSLVRISNPVLYNRKLTQPLPNQVTGRYKVAVMFIDQDSIQVPFDALVAGDRSDGVSMHGFFEIQIPVKDNIKWLKIIENYNKKQHAFFRKEDIIIK